MIVAIAFIVYLLAIFGALCLIAIGCWSNAQATDRAAAALERIAEPPGDRKVVQLSPRRPAA